jgi:hypothetical protein
VQVFGGLGVRKGTTVERLFRHSRAFRIFDGTSEIQQLVIARNASRLTAELRRRVFVGREEDLAQSPRSEVRSNNRQGVARGRRRAR